MRADTAIELRELRATITRLRTLLAAVIDPDGCSAEVLAEARAAASPSNTEP